MNVHTETKSSGIPRCGDFQEIKHENYGSICQRNIAEICVLLATANEREIGGEECVRDR